MRLSSKAEEQFTPGMCESVMINNKLFPHLYDPFYERKEVKSNMIKIVNNHRRE